MLERALHPTFSLLSFQLLPLPEEDTTSEKDELSCFIRHVERSLFSDLSQDHGDSASLDSSPPHQASGISTEKRANQLSNPLSSPNISRFPHKRKTSGAAGHLRIAWRFPWTSFQTVEKTRRSKRRCVSIHKEEDRVIEEGEEIPKNESSRGPPSLSTSTSRLGCKENEEEVREGNDYHDHELPPRLIDGEESPTGGKVDLCVSIEFSDWLESLLFHKTFIEPNEWRLLHLHFFSCQQIKRLPWREAVGCTYTSSMVMEKTKERKMRPLTRNLYGMGPLPLSVSFTLAMERLLKEAKERSRREEEEEER